jgi:hypothetical protein
MSQIHFILNGLPLGSWLMIQRIALKKEAFGGIGIFLTP